MEAETCATCEQSIDHAPVFFDGRAYCCAGCVAGGPCTCTYVPPVEASDDDGSDAAADEDASTAEATLRADAPTPLQRPDAPDEDARVDLSPPRFTTNVSPPRPAPAPPATRTRLSTSGRAAEPARAASTDPLEEPRAPIPFRRPGGLTVVVRIAGFADQRQLLRFAGVLEQTPEFVDVSLTRVSGDEAWFTVRAESPYEVAAALRRLRGFDIEANVDQNLVDARVGGMSWETSDDGEPSQSARRHGISGTGASLLPQRPRFRAFRPQVEALTEAPTETPADAQPEPATEVPSSAPALEDVPEAPSAASTEALPSSARPPSTPAETASEPSDAAASSSVANATGLPVAPRAGYPAARPPRSEEDDDEFVEPEERPGGAVMTTDHLTLVVYPFHSFAALNEFQGAIRQLHGVKNTRVRRFYRGTLHLAVDYEDMIPLTTRLADLKEIEFEIASESRSELEIVLQDGGASATAGDR